MDRQVALAGLWIYVHDRAAFVTPVHLYPCTIAVLTENQSITHPLLLWHGRVIAVSMTMLARNRAVSTSSPSSSAIVRTDRVVIRDTGIAS